MQKKQITVITLLKIYCGDTQLILDLVKKNINRRRINLFFGKKNPSLRNNDVRDKKQSAPCHR